MAQRHKKQSKLWRVFVSIINALGPFGRDFCLVVSGAIFGFSLSEGISSSTFKGDLTVAYVFAIIAFGFYVLVEYHNHAKGTRRASK